MIEREEKSPEELKALLRQRAELLMQLIDLDLSGSEIETVGRAAAMVYHAAERLYGRAVLEKELSEVAKHHRYYLAGLCEKCGKKLQDENAYLCESCSTQYRGRDSFEEIVRSALELFHTEKIQ
jgi:hypothetical protein